MLLAAYCFEVVNIRPILPLLLLLLLLQLVLMHLVHLVVLLLHGCEESLPGALVRPVDVLLEVALLVEAHLARWHRTVERLLVCVYAEVCVELFERCEDLEAELGGAVE